MDHKAADAAPTPNPGSRAAIEHGCTCPALDNNHGNGAYRDHLGRMNFWSVGDCPLHGRCQTCGEEYNGPFRCDGHIEVAR